MNICFNSKFALGISGVLSSFVPFFEITETVKQIGRYLIDYTDNWAKYLQIIMSQCVKPA